MILRIEIYDDISEEQIQKARLAVAELLGINANDVFVSRLTADGEEIEEDETDAEDESVACDEDDTDSEEDKYIVCDDDDNPIYEDERGCEFLRTWEEEDYRLDIWDTNRTVRSGPQTCIAYKLYHKGSLIFSGADFGCSPMHAVDSDECVSGLLGFLSLRPGDTDAEYFKDYTPEQMAFAESHGEELSGYAMELKENAREEREDQEYADEQSKGK